MELWHDFHDPEIEEMAQIAIVLGSRMALTYLPTSVATAMLATITTGGLFLSIHSASPGNTGANELVAGTAYTAVSGGRPPIAWAAFATDHQTSNTTQTFAMLTTNAGGIPYFGLWGANTGSGSGGFYAGGPTTGLSGSIPSGANVVFTSSVTLTIAG